MAAKPAIFMHYVYILKSQKKRWFYCGYSTDLRARFASHQKGKNKSTKNYLPLELIFYEAYKSKKDAKHRDKYFITNRGKRALRLMLKDSLC
jgi:putative endonuclease